MTSKQKLERMVEEARVEYLKRAEYEQKERPTHWTSWSPWLLALDVARDVGPRRWDEALRMCADIPVLAHMAGGDLGSIGERAIEAVRKYIANQVVDQVAP